MRRFFFFEEGERDDECGSGRRSIAGQKAATFCETSDEEKKKTSRCEIKSLFSTHD
jgi:hypothetical protein